MQTMLVMCLAQKMCVNVCGLEERAGVNFDGRDGLMGGVGKRTFCILLHQKGNIVNSKKKKKERGEKRISVSFPCFWY